MAKIGRADYNDTDRLSLDELKASFQKTKAQLQALREKAKENITLEQRGELRKLYSRLANLAKSISDRTSDDDERTKFQSFFEQLTEQAAKYGSAMRHGIPKTSFDDVKGLEDVKDLVKSFMFMAEHSDIRDYYRIKGNLGMLMYGAPGTGKTMFAEAVANGMGLPLFVITPADVYKSYVGASEQAVKLIFQEIEACEDGAILFIDECESIFSRRKEDTQDYKAAVTTELLQRMNGFGEDGSRRIMIAATNRPDQIDPAYLRYKRFSYLVHIPPPDMTALEAIITSKLEGIEKEPNIIDKILAKTRVSQTIMTETGPFEEQMYYSAADICGVIEEACRIAIERIQAAKSTTPIPLTMEMFDLAFAKIRPSISQSQRDEYEMFAQKAKDM